MMVFLGKRHQRWRKKVHEVRSNGNRGFLIWYIKSVTRSYHSRSWKSELGGSCYDQKNGKDLENKKNSQISNFVLNVPVIRIV